MGIFEKMRSGLRKTKDSMMGKVESILNSFTKIDEDLFEELEETLIMSDIGVTTSVKICDELREIVKANGVTEPLKIKDMLKEVISKMLGEETPLDLSTKPSVVLVIGVNGVGKTTTIGKLSYQLHNEGKKVIVAAADTFRAAAIDQLEVWTQRAGVDIVKHNEGSDPAAVVFDALTAAKARNADVVICDTAGRLHNKKNLMEELKKISRIVHQQAEGCSLEVLLVLDATTGQNAVNQAKQFNEVADITGIVLTKLDGTAKGGIIISIAEDLKVPVKLVGVGEKLDDLQPFSTRGFVDALFMDDVDFEGNYKRLKDEENDAVGSDEEAGEVEQEEQTEQTAEEKTEQPDDDTADETVEETVEDNQEKSAGADGKEAEAIAVERDAFDEDDENDEEPVREEVQEKKKRGFFRSRFGKKDKGE